MQYPVELVPDDNGTITVHVSDIPGCHSFGDDPADALLHAADAAESMLAAIIADREPIPRPSDAAGRPTITVSPMSTARIGLYQAMREAAVDTADLAQRLGWQPEQVDRLLELRPALQA